MGHRVNKVNHLQVVLLTLPPNGLRHGTTTAVAYVKATMK